MLLFTLIKTLAPLIIILNILPFLIWLERKGAAYIQDRRGPNRASLFGIIRLGGLIHSLTDVIKLITKEDIIPTHVNRFFYILAPFTAFAVACMTYAVIPFAAPIQWSGEWISLQAADLDAGVLYILAISSLGVFGIMLAGWSSNNKYSLLGGLRSSAQMISYEIVMSLAVISVLMITGPFSISANASEEMKQLYQHYNAHPLSFNAIIESQGTWFWNFLKQPLACLLFIVAMFAETNRAPFDLPEGESEIVAGYHLEYSSMKFALFFMAEYVNMIIAAGVLTCLFFGGWQVPFLSTDTLKSNASTVLKVTLAGLAFIHCLAGAGLLKRGANNVKHKKWGDIRDYEAVLLGVGALGIGLLLGAALYSLWSIQIVGNWASVVAAGVQAATFLAKILFFCWVFVWVRWTLPRFRYDQLMKLGWRVLLPLAIANIFITGLVLILKK